MNNMIPYGRLICLLFLGLLVVVQPLEAKFGKNKVQYKTIEWSYLQTPHFDIYFYEGGEHVAQYAADIAEKSYNHIAFQLNWQLSKRISIILYNSHNDFQQTNVTLSYLQEGIGGFTELFKNRVVMPFEGSYEQFRHVLHHELTHAIINDLIYGGNVQSIVSGKMRVNMPLWLTEGYAEYSSLDWDSRADMILRDAAVNGQLPSVDYLNYYMAYKGGQSVLRFIGETYGVERIGELFHEIRRRKNVDQALETSLGMDTEGLTEKWHLAVRRDYWPDIEGRENLESTGQRLTDHAELRNYFNVSPAISPNGGKIAFLSDRSGYADIYVMSADDGRQMNRIVSGQRKADLEELKWLSPGLSWAPNNRHIVFAAKSGDEDALVFFDTQDEKKKIRKLGLDGIFTASWSPNGDDVVFSGIKNGRTDLFLYSIKTRELRPLTSDVFSDSRPSWSADGNKIAFISDRGSILNNGLSPVAEQDVREQVLTHDFMFTDVYVYDLPSGLIQRITNSPGNEDSPVFSSTTNQLAYTSERSGISNIYLYNFDSGEESPLTNIMTGIFQLSWSADDSRLVFSGYEHGGWDIFSMNNPLGEMDKVPDPPLSNYLTRKNLQLDLTYSDTLPDRVSEEKREFEKYVFTGPESYFDTSPVDVAEPIDPSVFQDSSGDYRIRDYKTRFTVDLVDAQAGYSNFFGLQGNAVMVFSDILGNHRILFGFELYKDLQHSDLLLGYDYLANRTNLHAMLFNYPDQYQVYNWVGYYRTEIWTFRQYGGIFGLDYPLSKYSRIEGSVTWLNLYKRVTEAVSLTEVVDLIEPQNSVYMMPSLTWSFDNVLYGSLYPVDGWRMDVGIKASPPFPLAEREFVTLNTDIRRYFKVYNEYSFALRFSAGSSHGPQPEQYLAGGVANWLNYRVEGQYLDRLREYEDLYFSQYVTPIRGAPYFSLVGNHFSAFNAEFRFPFIEYLVLKWPISAVFGNVRGLMFADWVRVWDAADLENRSTAEILFKDSDNTYFGTGLGLRVNLGIFVLRYDLAYDMSTRPRYSDPQHIWSLGLDF